MSAVSPQVSRLLAETLMTLGEAARLFPAARRGRPPSPGAIWRWVRDGVRIAGRPRGATRSNHDGRPMADNHGTHWNDSRQQQQQPQQGTDNTATVAEPASARSHRSVAAQAEVELREFLASEAKNDAARR